MKNISDLEMKVKELFQLHVCVFSRSTRQHPLLPDHRNEHGECHVSNLAETVSGNIRPLPGQVRKLKHLAHLFYKRCKCMATLT